MREFFKKHYFPLATAVFYEAVYFLFMLSLSPDFSSLAKFEVIDVLASILIWPPMLLTLNIHGYYENPIAMVIFGFIFYFFLGFLIQKCFSYFFK